MRVSARKLLAVILFFVTAFSLSTADDSFFNFLQKRKALQWTKVPRKVLAFYYTWYGRPEHHGRWIHWEGVRPESREIASSTNYPAKGAYDSQDPEIIDYHIDLATRSGVDGFICTWWGKGTFDDAALKKVLERAKGRDFQITVYWEIVPGRGEAKIRRAVEDLSYLLREYGSHPSFLKVCGNPVIFVYGRVMNQVSMKEWQEIITRTEERWGKAPLLIADGLDAGYAGAFDGIHTYNICGWVQGKSLKDLERLSRDAFTKAVEVAKAANKISCLTVIPGYDDTKIRKPGINAERMGGDVFRTLWRSAIEADPDWVLITSWNEWHEGSEIEPSLEYGDAYLKITREFASRYKKRPFSRVRVERADVPSLKESFSGITLAVLPDFSGKAVFWLADAEVSLTDLTWEEVVDPMVFNSEKYPAAIYAGYERYRQTVREEGDVDAALLEYMKGGGLLIALASGPFPFFYNEKDEPVSSADRLGFPIEIKGWEAPPSGRRFFFELDNDVLKGLPHQVPFPEWGDLRWRPCTPKGLGKGDLYLPLARLKDGEGRWMGDGIVYIEHRTSAPKGARNLYAWMRMIDAADRNALLQGLFLFVAERISRQGRIR